MFENATLKLTIWYLLIIMVISVLFSALVYQSSTGELHSRLERFGQRAPFVVSPTGDWIEFRDRQASEAAHNILVNLLYINCLVLAGGGIASYLMARKTLRPLKEAHESESRFVSDASHELRTPLAAMKTELEVALRDPTLTPSEMRELLASNLEEVDKLTRLSQTLLTLSKMDYQNLPKTRVDLSAVTDAVVERYDKTHSRIVVTRPSKQLVVLGHESSVEELVTILVDNALKYSPGKSKITIRLGQRMGKVSFDITNSGKGIAAKDLPYIFDRFYRADNARSSSEKTSFGLGLSLAKTIVQLHNGELAASSTAHKSTTFSFALPAFRSSKVKSQA